MAQCEVLLLLYEWQVIERKKDRFTVRQIACALDQGFNNTWEQVSKLTRFGYLEPAGWLRGLGEGRASYRLRKEYYKAVRRLWLIERQVRRSHEAG